MHDLLAADLFIVGFQVPTKTATVLSLAELQQAPPGQYDFFWANVSSPNPSDLTDFLHHMQIGLTFQSFFNSFDILPHLHENEQGVSFYLYDVKKVDNLIDAVKPMTELSQSPVWVGIGPQFIITYHQEKVDLIDYVKNDYLHNFKLAGKSPAFILFLLIQRSLYSTAYLNLVNDNFLDSLESAVLKGQHAVDYFARLAMTGVNILTLKKLNANLHIILLMLVTKKSYAITEEARQAFHHMLKDTIAIREAIDSSRDLLDGVVASAQAESMHKTGEIMRVLTILTALFMPPTLIAGIYGMNFEFMPELHWVHGYYVALGLMGAVVFGSLALFKHLGWIFVSSSAENKPTSPKRRRHHRSASAG